MIRSFLFLLSGLLLISCGEDVVIKPAAKLRLEYSVPSYKITHLDCPFDFAMNNDARIEKKNGCNVNVHYPRMQATLYLTYQEVKDDNLNSLLADAQKLTYDHTIKANEILEQPRVDSINKVFGMFYIINGDAATQSQFYVTDSVNHFVAGSLYFESKPNFDSIYPSVVYLRDDIRRIMETISWKE
ncbi:MAG: gliding motility lipoprotein GldD [Flavobacteriaceae bacterium]|nr:gliding motility lipoprotein GldD [Flavobacteriaceae bacterium]